MDYSMVKSGVDVLIQRTDGRIHSAVISAVSVENLNVTVEWNEKGEIKGKDIDLLDILKLNSNLIPQKKIQDFAVVKNMPKESVRYTMMPSVTNAGGGFKANQQPPILQGVGGVKIQPENAIGYNNNNQVTTIASNLDRGSRTNNNVSINNKPTNSVLEYQNNQQHNNEYRQLQQQRVVINEDLMDTTEGQSPPRQTDMNTYNSNEDNRKNPLYRKKSNCVKEVERIQQKRQERRAQQTAIKEQILEQHQQHQVMFGIPVQGGIVGPGSGAGNAAIISNQQNWDFEIMIREFRKTLDYQPLTLREPIETHQICVCLRKRPLNRKELERKEIDVVTVPGKETVIVHEPKFKVDLTKYLENQSFCFDYAFDEKANNEIVYRYTAGPLVDCTFNGGMATCFAYGQTGSGKTHTMGGDFVSKGKQDCNNGIYMLAANDVFRLMESKYKHLDLVASASFFEIYSGKVFDLLNNKQKLRVLEDGRQQVQVVGLGEEEVHNVETVCKIIQRGNAARTSGVTSANIHSSRSHAVFQIILRKRCTKRLHGKFSLIDLAGNERGADTSSSDRQTRMEGAEINKSLLALKECIRALGRRGAHLPFRASKLTQILRDSFIHENSRTCMIAMISPGISCCEHTLNTLRYADRVKELGPSNGNLTLPQPTDNKSAPGQKTLYENGDCNNFPPHEEDSNLEEDEEDENYDKDNGYGENNISDNEVNYESSETYNNNNITEYIGKADTTAVHNYDEVKRLQKNTSVAVNYHDSVVTGGENAFTSKNNDKAMKNEHKLSTRLQKPQVHLGNHGKAKNNGDHTTNNKDSHCHGKGKNISSTSVNNNHSKVKDKPNDSRWGEEGGDAKMIIDGIQNRKFSPERSDLELLRNANTEELPKELYEFHEVVNRMQEDEEAIIDQHRELIERTENWLEDDTQLLNMTNNVDYDVEAYAQDLEELLEKKLIAISSLKERVSIFCQELEQEDQLSKHMKSSFK